MVAKRRRKKNNTSYHIIYFFCIPYCIYISYRLGPNIEYRKSNQQLALQTIKTSGFRTANHRTSLSFPFFLVLPSPSECPNVIVLGVWLCTLFCTWAPGLYPAQQRLLAPAGLDASLIHASKCSAVVYRHRHSYARV